MTEQPARRHPALAFPGIRGVRLAPIGADATLVNLSASGVLVECASRAVPGQPVTVQFDGTFSPATIESRVIRCQVKGIAADGTLRFHIGLAFNKRIALQADAEDRPDDRPSEPSAPQPAVPDPAPAPMTTPSAGAAPASDAVPRNRW